MLHRRDGDRLTPDVTLGIQAKELNRAFIRPEHLVSHGLSPSPPIAQFGLAASSRKSLGGSKLLPFKNDGGHCVLGDLQMLQNFFGYPSPELCLNTILSRSSTDNSFDLMAWFFCSDMRCQLWDLL